MALADDILNIHPWIGELGIAQSELERYLVEYADDPYGLVAAVRDHPAHRQRYPGLRNPDGSLKDGMNEQTYIQQEAEYRRIMSYYGDAAYRYDTPQDLAYFFDQRIDPRELEQRFELYTALDQGTSELRKAFYVYAGMDLTTDDLYTAVVQGSTGMEGVQRETELLVSGDALQKALRQSPLFKEYEARVSTNPPDYETWANRTVEFTLKEASEIINADPMMSAAATLPTPEDARRVLDTMYGKAQDGLPQPAGGPSRVSVVDLEQAYRIALIGSAASQYGFELADETTVTRWLEAGVQRAQSLQAYGQVATQGAGINATLARAGLNQFRDVTQMTEALLQGQGGGAVDQRLTTRLALAEASAEARLAEVGGASQDISAAGTIAQSGMRRTGQTR